MAPIKYTFADCQKVRELRNQGRTFVEIQKVVPMPIGYMSQVISGAVRVKR